MFWVVPVICTANLYGRISKRKNIHEILNVDDKTAAIVPAPSLSESLPDPTEFNGSERNGSD